MIKFLNKNNTSEFVSEICQIEMLFFQSGALSPKQLAAILVADDTIFITAVEHGKVVGYIYGIIIASADVVDLMKIAIVPKYQKQRIATTLLEKMEQIITEQNPKINKIILEVRQSNHRAIAFYQSNNFAKIGIRSKFYDKPQENAVIFEKIVKI